jgi:predicted glycogen debranching enzyme
LPTMTFSKDKLSFDKAIHNEWLITNGLGGFASSTVLGLNTRKYHALLIAALNPPGEKTVILSKLDEDINLENQTYQLGVNQFQQDIYPQGYQYLKEFSVKPFPVYTYKVGDFELEKTIFLPNQKNASIAIYHISNDSPNDASIKVFPLISLRYYHYVIDRNVKPIKINQSEKSHEFNLTCDTPNTHLIVKAFGGEFISNPIWISDLIYSEEANRGETSKDEGYQPGYFQFEAPKHSRKSFAIATVADRSQNTAEQLMAEFGSETADLEKQLNQELDRRNRRLTKFYARKQIEPNDGLSWLLQAADDFIVNAPNQWSVVAGFQWFGSWGRDTFISLPGLFLVKGMFDEAKEVFLDFSRYCKRGVIPNLIDDKTGEALYNTVDGTLWYINALFQYLKYSGDLGLAETLWPTLNDILENHRRGTLNGIHVDSDGLLAHGPQLTWMDAVVENKPYTPRSGKAVEVQALWYNSLRIMEVLADKFGETNIAEDYSGMAQKAKSGFDQFWDSQSSSLYDVIDDLGIHDCSIRPNQVIVGALDFPLLSKEKNSLVVDFVQKELLTPVGLRTLPPKDPRYRGHYGGSREDRDRAYHSGTIWPWLSGPFITAYLRAKGSAEQNRQYVAKNVMEPIFTDLLPRGGIGSINEIYDGDPPYMQQGCIAQAWSVAEPLRAYIEDVLQVRPKFEKQFVASQRRARIINIKVEAELAAPAT